MRGNISRSDCSLFQHAEDRMERILPPITETETVVQCNQLQIYCSSGGTYLHCDQRDLTVVTRPLEHHFPAP
eukprot:1195721-Prorocentrum_minimum.AAC.5